MIVLQYDPYSQTARFKSESEETGAVSDFKNLNKSQKDALKMLEENIILQNQIENLVKVLKTIDSRQRFRFIGTRKDYRDFKAGLKELAPSGCVEKSDTPFFYEPTYIREQLQKICGTVRQDVDALNKKYPEYCESLHFDSSELDTMLADRTPLVFMGSGSAGKSSVINAIVGAEILPTGDGTTTEFVCEIIPDNYCYAVSYQQNGSTSKIDLNGTQADAEANMNAALPTEIHLDTENPYDWVYTAVQELSKQENIEKLQVRVPFKNLPAVSSQIVIYDTPGPDTETCKRHKGILNTVLGQFKKGVAVFVTQPTEIEKTNLRSFLKKYTDNPDQLLDILNVNAGIVIVNGADRTDLSKIEDGKESRKTHLKQAADDSSKLDFLYQQGRVIYFSSPFALGVHKTYNDTWMDCGFKKANRHQESMDDPGDDDYLPLATVTELPVLRKQAIIREYEEAEKRYLENKNDENRKELIAHNSGLRAVEYEFGFVVNELSICNLCTQAQKQLEDVLRSVQENTKKISEEITHQEDSKTTCLKGKYQAIVNDLFDGPHSVMNRTLDNIKDVMVVNESQLIADAIKSISDDIGKQWHEIKQNPQPTVQRIVMNNQFVKEIWNRRNIQAKLYCNDIFEQFKDKCVNTVYGSNNLSSEEKDTLERCVKQWSAIQFNANLIDVNKEKISKQIFIFFSVPDKRKCGNAVEKDFTNFLGGQLDRVNKAVESCITLSCKRTRELFLTDEKIKEVNPELKTLTEQIDKLKNQNEDYAKLQKAVTSKLDIVSNLVQLQKKEEV